jgi:membrane protease subunit HflC
MKRNLILFTVGLLVTVLLVLFQVLFTVEVGESAVVTTFGKPERAIEQPGLYLRWPWPIQKVYRFDSRVHVLEGTFEETLTQDGKNILVAVYAGWRIAEPIKFLERVGSIAQAERNLDGLLRNYKNTVLGQHSFANLVNVNPQELRFEQIEQEILAAARPEADDRYGVAVTLLGIHKIGLPATITEKVFERMRAERKEIAERYRSEGEAEAIKIRAQADSERDQILARAEAGAKRIKADGDAKAAEYYATFEKHPSLAMFLRKLEVLETTLREKSTVVLSCDTEPFDLLRGDQALPGNQDSQPKK